MNKLLPAAAIMVAICLSACAPRHAEWEDQCVSGHTEMMPVTMFMPDGNGQITPMTTLQEQSVCDLWGRACVPGRDGSTVCGPDRER